MNVLMSEQDSYKKKMFYYEQLKDESIRQKKIIVAKASEDTYFYSITCRFTDCPGSS